MKDSNQKSYFTRVEDKYVFRISTAFWHLLIGIITVAAIAGIAALTWSLVPPGKEKIKAGNYPVKPAYPPVEKVLMSDLNLTEIKVKAPEAIPAQSYQQPVQIEEAFDPDKAGYDLLLAELRSIIPQDQWQPGSWYYPMGELAWEMHQTDNYREFRPGGISVEEKLNNSYKVIKIKNYAGKKRALTAYLKVLKQLPKEERIEVINAIVEDVNENFKDLVMLDSAFTLLSNNLKTFNNDTKNAAKQLISFTFRNQKTAFVFIPFAVEVCSQFSDTLRNNILYSLTTGFNNYFNGNIEVEKEATGQFLQLLPQIKNIDPSIALRRYYLMFNQKNQKRNEDIARIDNEYYTQIIAIQADSMQRELTAQAKYSSEKVKKSSMRWLSVKAIGGGFIAVALLGTILTLLSIQRILKRMEATVESRN